MSDEVISASVLGSSGGTVRVRHTGGWDDEVAPIECPICHNVAQWRKTAYRCKAGHEWRRAK